MMNVVLIMDDVKDANVKKTFYKAKYELLK